MIPAPAPSPTARPTCRALSLSRRLAPLTGLLVLLTAGCDGPASDERAGNTARIQFDGAQVAEADIAARVNGEPITEAMIDAQLTQQASTQPGESPDRRQVLNELIAQELLAQQAREQAMDENPALAARLANAHRSILAQATAKAHGTANPVTEDELRETYDTGVAGLDTREYKARHILVDERAAAEAVIDELEGGGDFAALARERSTGPSAEQDGDLGWFQAAQMVPPFGEALETLEPGEFTHEPLQTRFGWHVILLEDTRERPKPAFEDIKDNLRGALRNAQIQDYLQQLRDEAEIEVSTDYARGDEPSDDENGTNRKAAEDAKNGKSKTDDR